MGVISHAFPVVPALPYIGSLLFLITPRAHAQQGVKQWVCPSVVVVVVVVVNTKIARSRVLGVPVSCK